MQNSCMHRSYMRQTTDVSCVSKQHVRIVPLTHLRYSAIAREQHISNFGEVLTGSRMKSNREGQLSGVGTREVTGLAEQNANPFCILRRGVGDNSYDRQPEYFTFVCATEFWPCIYFMSDGRRPPVTRHLHKLRLGRRRKRRDPSRCIA